jgi:Family of unknown function (DUF6459)
LTTRDPVTDGDGPGRHPRLPARQEAAHAALCHPAITAHIDIWEERDTLRRPTRRQLSPPAQVGARIALGICEVEAGLRSPLQLEQRCHLTLWPKLAPRLRRSGGPAVPVGSLVRVIAQEHVPGLAEVTVLVRRGERVVPVAMRLDGAKGRWELVELQY